MKNIIVCIKQVPDTTEVRIDSNTNTLIREGIPCIINPFDLYAIEEGLRIKEKYGGKVIVISMGPPQVVESLKEAISLGVDEAILLSDRKFAGSDTLATSYTLSRGILKIGDYDIIICGKQAIDGDTAQVGPGIAEFLNIPQITYVRKIREITDNSIVAERLTETGIDVIKSKLPVLLTVVKEINEPRLPSLKNKMKAKKYQPIIWGFNDLDIKEPYIGLDGSPTRVIKIFSPQISVQSEMINGEPDEVAKILLDKLKI
ncbi:MAG TPA: electron transfer flavoprotein subunit beta/FixA family protein [bacterium]|nr:electron transfer flavoprotein subunit beta/FixA family protein [bacterium]HOL46631.1 electron transfer flavoprotein subunit beta/FixA family protein [bacterium]HPQ17797.1 electron transfer flavoprotein subunit beta/FixA family protein [bacterium]